MKKTTCLAAALLLSLYIASAIEFNITGTCPPKGCISSTETEWNITLYNFGSSPAEIREIGIKEAQTGMMLGKYNLTTNVMPNRPITAGVTGVIPNYTGMRNLTYNVCFIFGVSLSNRVIEDVYVGEERYYCEKKNFSLAVIECERNPDCLRDHKCMQNTCVALNCTPCQYIQNQSCLNYECCSDEECGTDMQCRSNTCRKLKCNEIESAKNHTCVPLDCKPHEKSLNNSCVDAGCRDDEIYNGNCTKLGCMKDEYAKSHQCIKLNCSDDEAYGNSTCITLSCGENETTANHTCRKITCPFYSKISEKKCRFNSNFIFLSIEPFAIAAAALLIIMMVKKYKLNKSRDKK
ncbi:hypothetical protein HYU11_04740 [Candidatus Woesearchaeota archaeon]|nr:hypothetical protein [Candidatus Woesearchaeota archaeon]